VFQENPLVFCPLIRPSILIQLFPLFTSLERLDLLSSCLQRPSLLFSNQLQPFVLSTRLPSSSPQQLGLLSFYLQQPSLLFSNQPQPFVLSTRLPSSSPQRLDLLSSCQQRPFPQQQSTPDFSFAVSSIL
jgi:hypothetical protein